MAGSVTEAIENSIVTSLSELVGALEALRSSHSAVSTRQAQQTQFALERLRDCQSAVAAADIAAQDLVKMLGLIPAHGEVVERVVSEAIGRRRVLWITYTDADGDHTEREIEPVLLDRPLVLAYCRLRQSYRRFNVARMGSAALTSESFFQQGNKG